MSPGFANEKKVDHLTIILEVIEGYECVSDTTSETFIYSSIRRRTSCSRNIQRSIPKTRHKAALHYGSRLALLRRTMKLKNTIWLYGQHMYLLQYL